MIQPNSAPQPDGPFQPGSSLIPVEKDLSAEYHLKLGKSLYQSYLARSRRQDLDQAIQHFQKALEMEPNLAEAYVQLASAMWDQGTINLELAQFYCETALKLDPTQADANLFLGYFLQRAGFLEEATQQYGYAIRKNFFKSARSRIALGNVLLKQALETNTKGRQIGFALQGTMQFMMGLSMLPFDWQTCSLLKEALMTDAQVYTLDFMAKGLKQMKLPQLARKVYGLGMKMMPKEAVFYHLMGDECLYEMSQPNEAIAYYKKAQALDPNHRGLFKKLGRAYADAKDNSHAVEALLSSVELEEDDFDAYYQLAQLHVEEKAYMKALYYFKEAEKHCPRNPYLHSNMAYVLFKMEDIDGAVEEYKTALDYGTDPLWLSTVSQTLGTILYQMFEEVEPALDYLQQSLHYNPENQETIAMLADLYFESGQLEMALSAYKSILQMEPKNADCYSNIGYILWQMDKNDAAVDAYLTALHYDKNNPIAYNNLGVIYLDEEHDPEKALPLFDAAVTLKSEYTLACFNLGRALEALDKTLEAAEHYGRALKLNQINKELEDSEIQERLDRLFD